MGDAAAWHATLPAPNNTATRRWLDLRLTGLGIQNPAVSRLLPRISTPIASPGIDPQTISAVTSVAVPPRTATRPSTTTPTARSRHAGRTPQPRARSTDRPAATAA